MLPFLAGLRHVSNCISRSIGSIVQGIDQASINFGQSGLAARVEGDGFAERPLRDNFNNLMRDCLPMGQTISQE